MAPVSYDVVMATRNRPEALRLSIPLILSQSRLPSQLIIVDSSDNPAPTAAVVGKYYGACPTDVKLLHSAQGTSLQRNIGLRLATSDVVFFPDDDLLVHPGALQSMLRIYELDRTGVIGGVCSAEAIKPPPGFLSDAPMSYQMSAFDRLKLRLGRPRNALENRLFPDPYLLHAHSQYSSRTIPEWLGAENAVLVEWMTGFRMSFRTELIRRCGFDETLGRYALHEDTDAGFQVMKTHLLVGARNAQIYHHKMPGARDSGRRIGGMNILNRAYIIAKHAEPSSSAVRNLQRYSMYKLFQYSMQMGSAYGRERLRGAVAAYR